MSKLPSPNCICQICGIAFHGRPSQGRKYCSRACSGKNLSIRNTGANNPAYGAVFIEKTCPVCASSFQVYEKDAARRPAAYCSKKCYGIAKDEKTAKTCLRCGVVFRVSAYYSSRKYCSPSCAVISRRKEKLRLCAQCGQAIKGAGKKYCSVACFAATNRGANNPSWKGGVVKTDCRVCGKEYTVQPALLAKGLGAFCSQLCMGKWKSSHPTVTNYGRGKGGKRPDLDNRYFRSSWEANYARYLNFLMKVGAVTSWEYEPETFDFVGIKRGARFYTPDFKVVYADGRIEYHEIKGWMDKTSATKLKRMAKYHPQITVVLIEREAYTAMARQFRHSLEGWEFEPKHGR